MVSGVAFARGDAFGVIAPWFVAIFNAPLGEGLARGFVELADQPAGGVDEVVESIAGLPVRTLPPFAVGVIEPDVVRLLLRGEFAASIEGDGPAEIRDGSGFRTWRELTVERPCAVRIGVRESLGEEPAFWTTGGVVPVSVILLSDRTEDASGSDLLRSPHEVESSPPIMFEAPAIFDVIEDPAVAVESQESIQPAPDIEPEHAPEPEPDHAGGEEGSQPVDDLGLLQIPEALESPDDDRLNDPSDQTLLPPDPWDLTPPPTSDPEPSPTSQADAGEDVDDPYADLWHTRLGSIEDAAIRLAEHDDGPALLSPPKEADPHGPSAPEPQELHDDRPVEAGLPGDHDGHTRAIDPSLVEAALGSVGSGADGSDGVPSSPCVNGHPNPPFTVTCRRCLAPVRDVVERVARADGGVLVLPDGERVVIDRTLIIGRNPKAKGLYSGEPPRLVSIPNEPEISRTHITIELSGWTATVTDEGSANGTEIELPGKEVEQLRPHVPMAIVVGTRIVLANDVRLKVEGG